MYEALELQNVAVGESHDPGMPRSSVLLCNLGGLFEVAALGVPLCEFVAAVRDVDVRRVGDLGELAGSMPLLFGTRCSPQTYVPFRATSASPFLNGDNTAAH